MGEFAVCSYQGKDQIGCQEPFFLDTPISHKVLEHIGINTIHHPLTAIILQFPEFDAAPFYEGGSVPLLSNMQGS
eukprot:1143288-Pelagomonas_calceolata.AAC.2